MTGTTGTTRTTWRQHGVETTQTTWRPQPWGYGYDVGITWGQWRQCGDDGDDMGMMGITKNAITLEQIVIIQFYLKIWDP